MAEETEVKTEEEKVATPAPSHLDELEESILSTEKKEDKPAEKKEEEEEFVEEDVDMDTLKEKHSIIDKLKLKHSSVNELLDDVLTRYAGGQEQFQQNAEFIKDLEREGVVTPDQRKELLIKLKAKADIAPPAKPETEKTFKDTRKEKLSTLIPKQTVDPETEESRPLTDEEKGRELKKLEDLAEMISPSHLPDTVNRIEINSLDLKDELSWALFKLQPLLEEHKDKLLPDSVRGEILEHSKKFPKTYAEIVEKAERDGKNYYTAVYHHFITTTKKEQIEAEKKKQWEAEYKADEEKRKSAKGETTTKPGEPEKAKTFFEMSLAEKERHIEAQK